MATYKRGEVYWYEFIFGGQSIRESAKTTSKTPAKEAERKRRRELEEGYNGVRRRRQPQLFSVASQEWLTLKAPALSPRSLAIEKTNLNHLQPVFGKLLLSDIGADDISKYQQRRLEEGASPKTINRSYPCRKARQLEACRDRTEAACAAGSMISGTRAVRGCWKRASRSPSWLPSWDGARLPR